MTITMERSNRNHGAYFRWIKYQVLIPHLVLTVGVSKNQKKQMKDFGMPKILMLNS